MGKRNATYEFIRVISMVFVIGVHSFATISPTYAEESLAGMIVSRLFFLCNGLFFMISGKFALSVRFQTGSDYKKFYLKRIGSIGIPVMIGMLLRSMFNIGWWPDYFLSVDFLNEYIRNVLYNFSSCEYWFLYKLIGFLAIAPFLGKTLQLASKVDLFWMIGVCVFWNTLCTYLPVLGFSFAWEFPLDGWFVFFVLGYALEQIIETKKAEKILLILGGITFVVSIILQFFGLDAGANGMAPTYAVAVSAMFIALKRLYRPGKVMDMVTIKIGKLTMSVYLLHMIVMYSIVPFIPSWPFFLRASTLLICTTGITLIFGCILEEVVFSKLRWIYLKIVGIS